MYAVIETGGKQYRVQKGDTLKIERISGEPGSQCCFDRVLLIGGNGQVRIGTPTVEKASVVGKIVKEIKGDKLTIFKYKRRKNYRWKMGHRQHLSVVQIEEIKTP